MDDPIETIVSQFHQQVNAWAKMTEEKIRTRPGSPDYPLSALMLTASLGEKSSDTHWITLADVTYPNTKPGFMQALYMSRELLITLYRLESDFNLGMIDALTPLMDAHPLIVKVEANPPGRTIVELVEDRGQGSGG